MKLLIIGKLSPPAVLGGVTIYCERLLEALKNDFEISFYDLSNFNFAGYIKSLLNHKVIHLNCSNVFLRFITSIICFFLKSKLIITYHGNIERFNLIKNLFDYLSIYFTEVPILINKTSYEKSLKFNSNSKLISTFFEPKHIPKLDSQIKSKIKKYKKNKKLFLTYASDLHFDKKGNEIYGIGELVKLFYMINKHKIIIIDPTKNLYKYVRKKYPKMSDYPLWFFERVNFISFLKLSDGFIRNSYTDGDSISVRESLHYNIPCYAKNSVDRPKGVILYENINDLKNKLSNKNNLEKVESSNHNIRDLKRLYMSLD